MSYVAEGKSVLCICEKVDRKPASVEGMPLHDAAAAKKIFVKYVKTRDNLVQTLAELLEMSKVTSLPDVILIDDLHVFTGCSDVDADCDVNLAKVFAIMMSVLSFIRGRKCQETSPKNEDVILAVFSRPLVSRGNSLSLVCRKFFDLIFQIKTTVEMDQNVGQNYSMTSQGSPAYQLLFQYQRGKQIRLKGLQLECLVSS